MAVVFLAEQDVAWIYYSCDVSESRVFNFLNFCSFDGREKANPGILRNHVPVF